MILKINNSQLLYGYYLTDHLGSTRAVADDAGTVLEAFDYYPFGLRMPKRNTAGANTIEKFTGKERDTEAGLDIYYMIARGYNPMLGRFMQIDRFHHKYPSLSTYQYAANNPVNLIDVNGDSIDVSKLSGKERTELINNLAEITGYAASQFSVSNGMLVISTSATTKDGTLNFNRPNANNVDPAA